MPSDNDRTLDVFDYKEHFMLQLLKSYDYRVPLQIELHPGVHCDLYRCPYCYGHAQQPMPGRLIQPAEIGALLDALAGTDPLLIVSGITTEPLTHPAGVDILREIRSRNCRLGLFTKGYRFDEACADTLFLGTSECFVTFSMDAVNSRQYVAVHDIPTAQPVKPGVPRGEDYFGIVLDRIRSFYHTKRRLGAAGAHVEIRIAVLMFEENSDDASMDYAVDLFSDMADVVRFAFPQIPNNGITPNNLPSRRSERIVELSERYRNNPKVRVLSGTSSPMRDQTFEYCHTQRFQITVDKSGNLFPCPQVAVGDFASLSFGNLRDGPIRQLLESPRRRHLFGCKVSGEMGCRICDRKDEAINIAVDQLQRTFRADVSGRRQG